MKTIKLDPADLEITHTKGSGPGGQNRNKRMTAVRVVHLPTGITVLSTERRSQGQNLSNALERLTEKLERHFYRPAKRVPTRKSRGSQERRHAEKRKSSINKSLRRKPRSDD
jgi:protein subunit release factor A